MISVNIGDMLISGCEEGECHVVRGLPGGETAVFQVRTKSEHSKSRGGIKIEICWSQFEGYGAS